MNACLIGSMRDLDRIEEIAKVLRERHDKVTMPIDDSEARFGDRRQAKTEFLRGMYERIKGCDTVLAVNDRPRGSYDGYIGPSTFLELGLGFALGKDLFCLQPWDKNLPYDEELRAMGINVINLQQRF